MMRKDELHEHLIAAFDLVVDPGERGGARTYFLGNVTWHPSSTTRILHVQYDGNGRVSHIKRCVSSDNNNSVFVPLPADWIAIQDIVAEEIARFGGRLRLA